MLGAAPVDLALIAPERGAALGALAGEAELALVAGAQFGHRPDHLGDDLARLAQDDRVADQHALAPELILVVQGGAVHGRPADLDRGHHRERRDPPGPADADPDVEQLGVDLLGRVLVGDRPPGRPAGRPHRPLHVDRVDLHDHAVDVVRRLVPVPGVGVVVDVALDLGQLGHDLVFVADRQAPAAQPLVPARLRIRRPFEVPLVARPGGRPDDRAVGVGGAHHPADAVHDRAERAGGGDPRVLLPQGARGGVAGIGEGGLARLLQRLVQPVERLGRQEDLAAHLEQLGYVVPDQPVGDRLDRLHVQRDVLAGPPVTAGGGADEPAALVHQVDREPVDLELTQVGPGPAELGGPVGPGGELLGREHVVQAEQPLQVLDGGELGRDRPADVLGGRVGGAQLRELVLDRVELPQPGVVLDVGDRRGVEHVVPVLRVKQRLAQLGVPPPGLSQLHLSSHPAIAPSVTSAPPSARAGSARPRGTSAARRAPGPATRPPARRPG